jgi:hypothetical protein
MFSMYWYTTDANKDEGQVAIEYKKMERNRPELYRGDSITMRVAHEKVRLKRREIMRMVDTIS